MATRYDAVIEAVRYTPEGQVELARGYERRGATYSDRVLFTRVELVKRLRAGQKMASGKRVPLLASTFELGAPILLAGARAAEVIVTQGTPRERDLLDGVPLF